MAAFSGFLDEVHRELARPSYPSMHVETNEDVLGGKDNPPGVAKRSGRSFKGKNSLSGS